LIGRQGTTERIEVTSLIRAFAFPAKLANTLHDEFQDIDGETQVARLAEPLSKLWKRPKQGEHLSLSCLIIPTLAYALGLQPASYI
jgi:hypothetical protein